MSTKALSAALLAIWFIDGDVGAHLRAHIAPQNQSAQSGDDSARFPQTRRAVADLLWSMLQTEEWRREYEMRRAATDPANFYTVGDFRWIDVDRDGSPDLIATLSATPRLIYSQVIVARHVATTFDVQRISILYLENLADAVKDLNGDGTIELVVPIEYAAGSGQNVIAWPVVLQWSGDEFVDASDRFPEVYEGQLPAVRDEVLKLERRMGSSPSPLNVEQLAGKQLILDRLLRATNRDINAPMRRAEHWMTADNPVLRTFAITVFEAFPEGTAADRLRLLARDSDPTVREHATLALEAVLSGKPR